VGSGDVILLDTHVWLWWLSEPDRLSAIASERISDARRNGIVAVSAISAWEAAMLIRKNRLELRVPPLELVASCARLPFFRFVPIGPGIAVASVELEGLHPDPADRMIVATARHEGLDLITKDERLHAWPGAQAVW
jgi:PIN domain nuclease of toxin-antitoxin system